MENLIQNKKIIYNLSFVFFFIIFLTKTKKTKKEEQKKIAKKRIIKLFELAEKKAFENNFDLADRYVHIARKISMKYLVKIPDEYKRNYCKYCYSYLLPGFNKRIRIKNKKLVIFCSDCNRFSRLNFNIKKNKVDKIEKK